MSIITSLTKLKELGIGIRLVDDQLKISAPREKLTPDLLNELKERKEDIIAFFRTTQVEGDYSPIKPGEGREYYVLSSAQKRMYILQQMALDSTAYNIPQVVILDEGVTGDRLEQVFAELIVRHESFRTSFLEVNEEPVQRVHRGVGFEIEYYNIVARDAKGREDIIRDFVRPFDLARPPLLRVGLIETGHPSQEGKCVLLVDMHHIIGDGVSIGVLVREFRALYEGRLLPGLRIQYRDYAQWQDSERVRKKIEEQQGFWLKEFGHEVPVLELPLDYARPAVQSYEGHVLRFRLSDQESRKLTQLTAEHGVTLFMMGMALFNTLLSKLGSQEDVVVGTPIAGRGHADLQPIIGMFVNTLALRNYPLGEMSFIEFLREVKAKTLSAFENQEYQFEDLVEHIAVNRDVSRNPVFDVMFALQNTANPDNKGPDQTTIYDYGYRISKFDMTWNMSEWQNRLFLVVEYCTRLFKQATIERFIAYFKEIIAAVIAEPAVRLSKIAIISEEERRQILYVFNDTKVDYPAGQTIHSLFEEQVRRTPHAAAVGSEDGCLSYRELSRQSDELACCLIGEGVGHESAVGIMGDRCGEVIIGLLAILKAGGVYVPINIDYPQERQEYLLKDSGAGILLTTPKTEVKVGEEWLRPICISPYPFEANASLGTAPGSIGSAALAYIIYTSGSTGNPKGVMVTHRNVVRLVKNTNYVAFKPGGRILQTGALEFDASTFEIWGSLLNGLTLYLVAKENILTPARLKHIITSHDIDTIWMTSPLFNQMLTEDIAMFSGLRNLLVGGDVLSPLHINQLRERFVGLNVINGYGPTENTTFSTTFLIDRAYSQGIPIGSPIANSTASILDRFYNYQPIGVAGELWVGGDGVGRGYLNDPELTAEKFVNFNLAAKSREGTRSLKDETLTPKSQILNPKSQPLYRTGDLCRWLPSGVIEFLGRIDFQVKIRGFRIELGEIESQLLDHPGIKEAVVTARTEKRGDKTICAYIVPLPTSRTNPLHLRDYLSRTLPDYMIPSYFVFLDRIPLTPNGKIDRRSLPQPSFESKRLYRAPVDPIQAKLAAIWSQILSIDQDMIGTDVSFFELGGHSLKATVMSGRIHRELDVAVPLVEIFRTPTIEGIGAYIREAVGDRFSSLEAVESREYYGLSSAQKRMYILQQMALESTVYNIPQALRLTEEVDIERLAGVFRKLIGRHESFRTSFVKVNEEPVQRVHKEVDFEIEYYNIAAKDFVRPFDLSRPPLLRVGLIEKSILMVDMHHIISDGTSMQVLVDEFRSLYGGAELPGLRIQYKDFSLWQESENVKEKIRSQEAYWLEEFSGEIPVLNLPIDYPRPAVQSFEGGSVGFELAKEESARLDRLALDSGVTLFMVLTALFTIMLSKLSGQQDIVMGTPTAGRRHADLERVIGMFVNTLALRNYPSGSKRFSGFLQEVKSKTLKAFENQEYPFEDLVEKVDVARDVSRNPLFDVMLVLQNIGDGGDVRGREGLEGFENTVSRFDMTWGAAQRRGRLYWRIEHCTRLFKPETIHRYAGHFKTIADAVMTDPEIKISDIDILSAEERNRILYTFNDTRRAYPHASTVHEIFSHRAADIPDHLALCLADKSLTYGELHNQSDRLALVLRGKGVGPETPVGLWLNRSIEMVLGVLGILKAGGAYVPIDVSYPKERVEHILSDSRVRLLLMQSDRERELKYEGEIFFLEERVTSRWEAVLSETGSHPSDLIYVIYTSGSTGRAKGILINHSGVVNILHHLEELYPVDPDGGYLFKTNYTFDVSVTELFGWFFGRGRLVILEPGAEKDPAEIIAAVERFAVTHINFVPSMLNVFLDAAAANVGERLRGLRYMLIAGEAFSAALASKLSALDFAGRVENIYGPTEGTIYTTRYSLSALNNQSAVPIGRPLNNITTYILGGDGTLLPVNIWGELCIGGMGLARGYLNRPELTAEKFVNSAAKSGEDTRSSPHQPLTPKSHILYKTGDLARFRPDGTIEFSGRLDFQVKVRGFRIELGEIEAELLRHRHVREAVAVARDDGQGDKYICAYVAAQGDLNVSDLPTYLSKRLPEYMIPSQVVEVERMPLTPAGKLDRRALPSHEVRVAEQFVAPRSGNEAKLLGLWSDVLGMPAQRIGIDSNFFKLGGHSLKAVKLLARIHREFNVEIPLVTIFKELTIRALAEYIEGSTRKKFASIEAVELREYYRLSSAQQRLYILQQLDLGSTVYNMPQVVRLADEVDGEKLGRAFRRLIARHESLRTSFIRVNEEPVQRVHTEVDFEIEYYNITAEDFVRPFDLSKPPLLRVGLIEKYNLMVDMHHIISDGESMKVLVEEFRQLYDGAQLPELRLQYKDYSQWQQGEAVKEKIKAQEAYWLKEFSGEIPVLNLPSDYIRPAVQSFEGSSLGFEIAAAETTGLKQLAISQGTTLYSLLLALFNILLSKLSGQEDIVDGTPIAGRRHADLERVIGMFVNTLALRSYPSGEKGLAEFLEEVRSSTLAALENQEYQFEDLVEKVEINRDVSRNPLFDVMFSFGSDDSSLASTPGNRSADGRDVTLTGGVARFDMTFMAVERSGQLSFVVEYCTRLFRQETIGRYVGYFKRIVSAVTASPALMIADIDILSEGEKKRVVYDLNNTEAEFPQKKTIHQVFAEQAAQTADWAAVIFKDSTLTYRELNLRAGQLAGRLRRCGAETSTVVGLLLQRSAEMMIGLLAILKSGGAYLPLDPLKPGSRLQYMLQDSSARILLTTRQFSKIVQSDTDILCIDDSRADESWPGGDQPASTLTYVIYTSGSTGKPKGAMIEHRSVMNRLNWMQKGYPIGVGDVIIQKTPFDFDVSVWELFWWGFHGASVCFLAPGAEKDPEAIMDAVDRYRITTIHFVPSMLHVFLTVLEEGEGDKVPRLRHLKQVFASGEALAVQQVHRFYDIFRGLGQVQLINLYGPTEATVDVSYFNCPRGGRLERVPIGKPIDNIGLYVLDKNMKPLPVGVSGELYIGGTGLGRGYLNRPELTAEKFVNAAASHQPQPPKSYILNPRSQILYRSGDLVRWLDDGNLEFLGRLDYQVKIRGNRIELGEIENQLHDFPAAAEAVVTVREEEGGDRALTAYVVPTDRHALTVRRLLELEKKGLHLDRSRYVWPNGMSLFYLNRGESDFMYREIFQENSYFRHGITLNPGACVFDLGANIGVFSMFVNRVCRDAEIYAFEPIPPVFEVLSLNMLLYGAGVKVFNHGISDQEGEVDLTYYPHATILSGEFADREQEAEAVRAFISSRAVGTKEEDIGDSQVSELLDNRLESSQFKCRMKTLSRVMAENRIDRIDLLKIDVEKAELNVLRGINEADWSKIFQIVIEVHDVDGRLEAIKDLLLAHGYRVTVDQDRELENTNLYNLYAVLADRDDEKQGTLPDAVRQAQTGGGDTWYSPERLVEDMRSHLLHHLPEYMMPSSFVLLEQMPLTANGKIDRKALPNPLKAAGEKYVAPRDEVETRLAALWSEVLGLDKESIGTESNFFELGGHSLKATILVSRVQREFKLRMPLNRIFQDSTIVRMAEYIKGRDRETVVEDESLVLLREGNGQAGHLFLIHDGTGEVDGYREFCRQLTAGFNCWGLRAYGIIDHGPRNVTIPAIAGKYVDSMKRVQPHGPYSIVGWSLGGTVAFEMALQLERLGETITFLGLIDAPGPQKDTQEDLVPFTLESELDFVKDYIPEGDIKERFKKISQLDALWSDIAAYLYAKNFDVDIIKRAIIGYGMQALPNFNQLGIGETIYYLNLGRSLSRARANYTPGEKIQTRLHFIKASQSPDIFIDNWRDYCIQPIQCREVTGDHYSILREPTSGQVAGIFNAALEKSFPTAKK
jgi:tyrocidine synthetase-3